MIFRVAESMTFGDYRLRVPIRINELPTGYQMQSARQDDSGQSSWFITLGSEQGSSATVVTIEPPGGDIPATNTHVGNYPAAFLTVGLRGGPRSGVPRADVSYTSLCVPTAPVPVCITVGNSATDDPETRREPFLALARQITYASSPTDISTWFDATIALPS